jgi:hypothetical protein
MHANFIRGNKKRCLLMRSIVKNSGSASSVQAPISLLGGNALGAQGAGAFLNQNVLTGVPMNSMGLPGQMPQLNSMLFPQAAALGGSTTVPNFLSTNQQQPFQQQHGNALQSFLNNGNLPNLFPFPGANLPSATGNAQQPFNIADFLNNGQVINPNNISGVTMPFNTNLYTPSNNDATNNTSEQTNTTNFNTNANGNVNSSVSNPTQVSTGASCNPTPSTSTSSQSFATAGVGGANPAQVNGDSTSPVVGLAMQIMQNNPSIDPRMALELARRIRGEA